MKKLLAIAFAFSLLIFCQSAGAASPLTTPYLAQAGCSMSHCDQTISGDPQENAPAGPVTSLWHDTSVVGSNTGLGCVSNTHVVACSFNTGLFKKTTIKEYSPTGATLWSSSLLDGNAYGSAPMVGPDGGVIAADDTRIIRYSPTGAVLWNTKTPGGIPISPTITDSGAVILATLGGGGPVSAYDPSTGALLAQTTLNATVTYQGATVSGYYDTINTPAVRGNRIYIETQFRDSATNKVLPFGRLYALDFDSTTDTFSVAWTWAFAAPSGGSPTVLMNSGVPTVYFDGSGTVPGQSGTNPQLFAVQDLGASANLLWEHGLAVDPQTAATPDPRGGVWTYSTFFSPNLVRLDQNTGAVLQTINVDNLVNQPGVHVPSSAMTITGDAQNPVMIISATPLLFQSSYLLAINLNTSQLNWDFRMDQSKGLGGVSMGQYPIVLQANGDPEVITTSFSNGVWGLGTQ